MKEINEKTPQSSQSNSTSH